MKLAISDARLKAAKHRGSWSVEGGQNQGGHVQAPRTSGKKDLVLEQYECPRVAEERKKGARAGLLSFWPG